LSAEALIDRLLAEVRSFCGEVAQEDDMTCVMVRVEE
jgi:serine phosphatase RsbU (regulator of sigma subunit)